MSQPLGPRMVATSVFLPKVNQDQNRKISITDCISVYCVLCTVDCVLCTVYCVLCTVYCVLCTVYCVLCTVFCAALEKLE